MKVRKWLCKREKWKEKGFFYFHFPVFGWTAEVRNDTSHFLTSVYFLESKQWMKYLLVTGVHRNLTYMNIEVVRLLVIVGVNLRIVHENRRAPCHNINKQKILRNLDNMMCVLCLVLSHRRSRFVKTTNDLDKTLR